ncbi:hypothetical protein BLAHAN_04686 [Blautia hansenii DSM 20583]|uniref:Uncharacterized protein n=1 Tax=Blautia hansenii DSM 20583 TaxID=537007 RepID=C9L5M8_BLAHA|nr:hypothetical protein BLAHAN_04686 [Blautia hansenii DSM 20583]
MSSSCRQFSFAFFTILSGISALFLQNNGWVLNKCYKSAKGFDK